MGCEKQFSMLLKIQELTFIANDLNLYLDTHPCDEEALKDYNQAAESARKLAEQYEKEFGPLYNFGLQENADDTWRWIDSPWPWEL